MIGRSATTTTGSGVTAVPGWSPWRVVAGFGAVSLAADMVYEGARSITGPLLGTLGASALLVGLVTGAGEGLALVLRLVFGPLADRTGRYWTLTLAGYALTVVCVPLLALTPFLGAAGLAVAATLILAERAGKAVRSPAKSALLAYAAGAVGRGRGFAVHKALDQIGAFAGPLLVAAVIAATAVIWPALALLAVPGALAIAVLMWIRSRVPNPAIYESTPAATPAAHVSDSGDAVPHTEAQLVSWLPRRFFLFAAAGGAVTAGLVTFGVISYHLTETRLVPTAAVPVIYAAAMATSAVAALFSGYLYDRWGPQVLLVLPALVAAVPGLALSSRLVAAVIGVLIWGAAVGIQDSTIKALVADLVPAPRRAGAYGVFAAVQGATALAGGAVAGALYTNLPVLITVVAATQLTALILLAVTLRSSHRTPTP